MAGESVYFQMRLRFPDEASIVAWHRERLLDQRVHLEAVPAFDSIDMGDDDLLGSDITVTGQTDLDGALAYLRDVGFPVTADRIVEWRATERDGQPAIWFAEAGPLPRTADVAALLAYLDSGGDGEATAVAMDTGSERELLIGGRVAGYDGYRTYRLPLIYAGTAATRLGASGSVSFLGDRGDEFVALFVDFDAGAIGIDEPDPQNLTEEGLTERLGVTMDVLFGEVE